jgi:hypothetical protein
MRPHRWIVALVLTLMAGSQATCAEPSPEGFLQRVAPAGGWHPYGGGLLRWWDPFCFPCGGAPDDYCRKSLPRVCWPPYPPYYIWAPQQLGCPAHGCEPADNELHALPHR